MPFALNEATRFISPTKTLEYLAADKPVVSTPIADVVELYGTVVRTASEPEEFVGQCEATMDEDREARSRRTDAARAIVAAASWDAAAARMEREIERALPKGLRPDVDMLFGEAVKTEREPAVAQCLVAGAGR